MNDPSQPSLSANANLWRIAGWSMLALLLALPALAMNVTSEVNWTATDFLLAAVLLGCLGIGIELAFRQSHGKAHLAGIVLTLLGGILGLWLGGAVGVIGDETNAHNFGLMAVAAAGLICGAAVRFRARPMTLIAMLMAVAQLALTGLAIAAGEPDWHPALLFVVIWALAACCFCTGSAQHS